MSVNRRIWKGEAVNEYNLKVISFDPEIKPLLEHSSLGKSRPPELSHYPVFGVILCLLRTDSPWRD